MSKKNGQQIDATIDLLNKKIAIYEKDLAIQKLLLEVSNAVDATPNLTDLFFSIHKALNRLIDAPNFYISIYDKKNSTLHFPYFIDEVDGDHTSSVRMFDKESLTGEVITRQVPLLLDRDALIKREEENRIVGSIPQIYLGVPLITEGTVIGAMAIQKYNDPEAYTHKDLDMLVSISRHIAVAIERKRINDALKENEQRYRTLSEMSHDIIMRFDRACRHLYVNPAIHQLGYTPEQMIGKTHQELDFPIELSKMWEDTIREVFNTRQVKRIEFKLPQDRWIDWLLCPEVTNQNQVNTVITFARDITERKEAEFANSCYDRINKIIIGASDLEQMLDRILDAMNEIFDSDRAWILFPCNPQAPYYEVSFLRCKPQWHVTPGVRFDITPEVAEMLEVVLHSEEPLIVNGVSKFEVRTEISKKWHVQSQIGMAVFPKTGDPWEVGLHQCEYDRVWTTRERRLFRGICQRISDGLSSMLLYNKLEQAKTYIDNVVDSMPSMLIGVDVNGGITQWNAKATDITGVTAKQAIGKSFAVFFPHLQEYQTMIQSAIQKNKPIEKVKLPWVKDENTLYQDVTVYPLKDIGKKGAVIKIDDVTDQVKIEEMMIQSEKMLTVGGLAAGMAHEINNPLAGMMQNAQVLLNRLATDIPANARAAEDAGTSLESIKKYMKKRKVIQQLTHIHQAGKQAAKVVENMLIFAKKTDSTKSSENLETLLKRTIELAGNDYDLKKRCDFANIKISHHLKGEFPPVLCEAGKIQQVFFNIIKNGAEAMAESKDSDRRPSEFQIHYSTVGGFAVIRISDNGPGMDAVVSKRIFEPFYTTKSVDMGTGLGLSVAYFIIVEDHRGRLSVESSQGKGCTFVIELPIHG